MVGYRGGVSILEIIVYVPCLFIALWLGFKHGFGRHAGWFFLILFSLIRIIGASFQLASESHPTTANFTGAAILESVGLSPLLLATLGLIGRIKENIDRNHQDHVPPMVYRLIQLVATVALILCIVGGVNSANSQAFTVNTLTKVGIIMFIVTYVAIIAISALTLLRISHADRGERRVLFAVFAALPFLAVRLIYAVLSVFTKLHTFNRIYGNVTVFLVMAVLTEFAIVAIYLGVGLTLRKAERVPLPPPATASTKESHGQRYDQSQGYRHSQRTRRHGLIRGLLSR